MTVVVVVVVVVVAAAAAEAEAEIDIVMVSEVKNADHIMVHIMDQENAVLVMKNLRFQMLL
jgi:hypothetical protein